MEKNECPILDILVPDNLREIYRASPITFVERALARFVCRSFRSIFENVSIIDGSPCGQDRFEMELADRVHGDNLMGHLIGAGYSPGFVDAVSSQFGARSPSPPEMKLLFISAEAGNVALFKKLLYTKTVEMKLQEAHHWFRNCGRAIGRGGSIPAFEIFHARLNNSPGNIHIIPSLTSDMAKFVDDIMEFVWCGVGERGQSELLAHLQAKGKSFPYKLIEGAILADRVNFFSEFIKTFQANDIECHRMNFLSQAAKSGSEKVIRYVLGGRSLRELPVALEDSLLRESAFNFTIDVANFWSSAGVRSPNSNRDQEAILIRNIQALNLPMLEFNMARFDLMKLSSKVLRDGVTGLTTNYEPLSWRWLPSISVAGSHALGSMDVLQRIVKTSEKLIEMGLQVDEKLLSETDYTLPHLFLLLNHLPKQSPLNSSFVDQLVWTSCKRNSMNYYLIYFEDLWKPLLPALGERAKGALFLLFIKEPRSVVLLYKDFEEARFAALQYFHPYIKYPIAKEAGLAISSNISEFRLHDSVHERFCKLCLDGCPDFVEPLTRETQQMESYVLQWLDTKIINWLTPSLPIKTAEVWTAFLPRVRKEVRLALHSNHRNEISNDESLNELVAALDFQDIVVLLDEILSSPLRLTDFRDIFQGERLDEFLKWLPENWENALDVLELDGIVDYLREKLDVYKVIIPEVRLFVPMTEVHGGAPLKNLFTEIIRNEFVPAQPNRDLMSRIGELLRDYYSSFDERGKLFFAFERLLSKKDVLMIRLFKQSIGAQLEKILTLRLVEYAEKNQYLFVMLMVAAGFDMPMKVNSYGLYMSWENTTQFKDEFLVCLMSPSQPLLMLLFLFFVCIRLKMVLTCGTSESASGMK